MIRRDADALRRGLGKRGDRPSGSAYHSVRAHATLVRPTPQPARAATLTALPYRCMWDVCAYPRARVAYSLHRAPVKPPRFGWRTVSRCRRTPWPTPTVIRTLATTVLWWVPLCFICQRCNRRLQTVQSWLSDRYCPCLLWTPTLVATATVN